VQVTERTGSTVDAVQLGRAIAAARTEQGLKRSQLALAAGVSYPYLSELENGTKHGSTRKIGQIADALGVTPSTLLARAESLARNLEGTTGRPIGGGEAPPVGTGQEPGTDSHLGIDGHTGPDLAAPVSLRPLGGSSDRVEELVVERVTRAVRLEIERWLDSELEAAVRAHVRDLVGRSDGTR
jgi:transcriptional regulator with XRE-family HTH domain